MLKKVKREETVHVCDGLTAHCYKTGIYTSAVRWLVYIDLPPILVDNYITVNCHIILVLAYQGSRQFNEDLRKVYFSLDIFHQLAMV